MTPPPQPVRYHRIAWSGEAPASWAPMDMLRVVAWYYRVADGYLESVTIGSKWPAFTTEGDGSLGETEEEVLPELPDCRPVGWVIGPQKGISFRLSGETAKANVVLVVEAV